MRDCSFHNGLIGRSDFEESAAQILAFNVMGSGIFLVLVGLAQRQDNPDAVPQAMVLTGIVVAVAATALALALIRKLHSLTGQIEFVDERDE